jgi:hypothetical protein
MISSVPDCDSALCASSSALVGLTSDSSTASCGAMPNCTVFAFCSGCSSASVASISASSLIDSMAGPFRRNGVARSAPPSPPAPCTW